MKHPESRRQKAEGRKQKAEGRRCLLSTAYCLLGLLCFSPTAFAEDIDIPLPADVHNLSEPYDVAIGSQPIHAQGFITSLSVEQLRTFYEYALPKNGWQLVPLPWAAQLQEGLKTLEKAKQEHPELENDPAFKEKVANLDPERMTQLLQREIYGERGAEHLLLNITSTGQKSLVFVNRWEGSLSNSPLGGAKGPLPQASGASSTWPIGNPCCTGASVPSVLRKLPPSVPQYPSGRLVSTGAEPAKALAGAPAMSEMYMTSDSVTRAADFYHTQMAYNGWTQTELPGGGPSLAQMLGPQAPHMDTQTLLFRNERGLCSVAIVQAPEDMPAVSGQPGSTERTVIIVNYVEDTLSQKLKQHTAASPLGTRP